MNPSFLPPRLFSLCATALLFALPAVLSGQTEKIANGDFESGLNNWQAGGWGDTAAISATVEESDPISGTRSAKLSIVQGTTTPDTDWFQINFVQFYNSAVAGRDYRASFKVRASEEIEMMVQLWDGGNSQAIRIETFTVGTAVETIRLAGTAPSDSTNVMMAFYFGKTTRGVDVWLDDVSVQEIAPPSDTATIDVDFDSAETAADLTGLLIGLGYGQGGSTTLQDPDEVFIDPIAPRYWRVPPHQDYIDRVTELGAIPIVIPSYDWWVGTPENNPGTYPLSEPPWDVSGDAEPYDTFKNQLATLAQANGDAVIYDVWNEPDLPDSFTEYPWFAENPGVDPFDKFLEVFKVAHDTIRAEVPDAIIASPSLSKAFDWGKLERFMDFCLAEGLTTQVLSLHMLEQDDPDFDGMREDLIEVRNRFMNDPQYSAVGLTDLYVTEYGTFSEQRMRPGSLMAMLRFMEEGLVDGAVRACWNHLSDCTGTSSCFDGTLSALLTCDRSAPRSIWWAYRWYTLGSGQRVAATSDNPELLPLASRIASDPADSHVMIASRKRMISEPARDMASVTVNLNGLAAAGIIPPGATTVSVWVYRAPYENLGGDPMPSPDELLVNQSLPVSGDSASLVLENATALRGYDALTIFFSEPPTRVPAPENTWSGEGADSDLNNPANWGGGLLPASGETVVFSGYQVGNLDLTFDSDVGGSLGWKLDLSADQTDPVTILNTSATLRNLRLKEGPTNTPGGSLDMAAGSGGLTIGGGDNPLQLVLTQGDGRNAELRNESAHPLIVADNATIISGGGDAGLILRGSGDFQLLGDLVLQTRGMNVYASGTTTLGGSNAADSVIRVAGNGTVAFTEAANIDGFTEIRLGFSAAGGQYGTLRFEGASDTVVTKQVRVGEGNGTGAIDASGNGTLTFSAPTFNVATPSNADLTLTLTGSNTGANTIAGVIQNHSSNNPQVLSLTKTGNGTWVLGGANTYTGATAVDAGALIINGSTAAASTVTVAAGAFIGGNGTVNGPLTLADGAGIVFDAGDGLTANGSSVDLGALSVANIQGLSAATAPGSYTLIDGTAAFDFSSVANLGPANAVALGPNRHAWFEQGSLVLRVADDYGLWAEEAGLSGADAEATADPDGDGLTNEEERVTGTDPNDPSSRYAVSSTSVDLAAEPPEFSLTFNTVPGRSYQVERSLDLSPGSWEPVSDLISGDGNPATFVDTPGSKAFYRIKVAFQ